MKVKQFQILELFKLFDVSYINLTTRLLISQEHADYSECVQLVKDIMLQRNASMISALEKVEKQCLSKVKNKKAKDFLKNDFEAVMFEIGRLLDARMTLTDSILESEGKTFYLF